MLKINEKRKLDLTELKIIEELSVDGRLPITTLAQRVGISKTPCQTRLKRLIEEGYILGFKAIINPKKLALQHIAFLQVKLKTTTKQALFEFNQAAINIPEIEQCHMIASSFDYLLKVRTRDIDSYRNVLTESISTLPHIDNTSTHISMQSIKDSDNFPV